MKSLKYILFLLPLSLSLSLMATNQDSQNEEIARGGGFGGGRAGDFGGAGRGDFNRNANFDNYRDFNRNGDLGGYGGYAAPAGGYVAPGGYYYGGYGTYPYGNPGPSMAPNDDMNQIYQNNLNNMERTGQ